MSRESWEGCWVPWVSGLLAGAGAGAGRYQGRGCRAYPAGGARVPPCAPVTPGGILPAMRYEAPPSRASRVRISSSSFRTPFRSREAFEQMRRSRSYTFTPFRIVRWSFCPGSACSAKKNVAPRAPRALAGPRCGARRIRQAPPIPDDTPPPDLSDALLLSIFRRIDWRDGGAGRIPIASVRASLTALSPAAFRVGLLDSKRRGAIVLRAAEGDDAQPEGALVRRKHDDDLEVPSTGRSTQGREHSPRRRQPPR